MTRPADYTPHHHFTMNRSDNKTYPPVTPKVAIERCRYWLGKVEEFFFEPGERERRETPKGE